MDQQRKIGSHVDLILTSGGTGFSPRDVTPEAVSSMLSRKADSLNQMMQNEALKITGMACLSRSVIGMISEGDQMNDDNHEALIVTLPGKPKAVKENFGILMKGRVLVHALHQLQN